ncbi:hypothetical protein AB0G79_02200 [Streptomyces sp. NPDC020807]|uniref:hypothetical protein n=1 Tax=Streptomyces sp. NPDC020807 TaxID=3155119 RepID=UPI00341084A8
MAAIPVGSAMRRCLVFVRLDGATVRPGQLAAPELPVRPGRCPSCRCFPALIIVAIALGIIGAGVDGLLFLLFIGIMLFVADLIHAAMRMRRSPPPRLVTHQSPGPHGAARRTP